MSDSSSIEWTDATWNPVVGCSRISPGCAHCYAKAIHDRRHTSFLAGGNVLVPQYAQPFEVVRPREDRLAIPLHWKKPRRVFVNSMSDLFHEDVPDAFIDRVFAVMALAPQHTFQILTKRAERMRQYVVGTTGPGRESLHDAIQFAMDDYPDLYERHPGIAPYCWPLPNVWLGVSVENQHFADERIPLLLQTPSAVRFVSAEPLLEGLDIAKHRPGANHLWFIVGGESGPGARPCDVQWIRSVVRQCQQADAPVFVKQLGAVPLVPACRQTHWDYRFVKREEGQRFTAHGVDPDRWRMHLLDRKGGDPAEWPEDLRVREYPTVGAHHPSPPDAVDPQADSTGTLPTRDTSRSRPRRPGPAGSAAPR